MMKAALSRAQIPLYALGLLSMVACGDKREIDIHVTNAPKCPAGTKYDPEVRLRFSDEGTTSRKVLSQDGILEKTAFRKVWIEKGFEMGVLSCLTTQPDCGDAKSLAPNGPATLRSSKGGYELELPKITVRCSDGTSVSN